jgi:hypothetical protein
MSLTSGKIGSTIKEFFGIPIAFQSINTVKKENPSISCADIPKTNSVPIRLGSSIGRGRIKPKSIKSKNGTEKINKKESAPIPESLSKLFPGDPNFMHSTSSIETEKLPLVGGQCAISSHEKSEAIKIISKGLRQSLKLYKIDSISLFYKNLKDILDSKGKRGDFEMDEKAESDCTEAIAILDDFLSISLIQVRNRIDVMIWAILWKRAGGSAPKTTSSTL